MPDLQDPEHSINPVDVSVVIAAWNAETFLEASVDSALAQGGVDLEVIISDDASTDGTAELARRLGAADPRVRLVSAPVNAGPSAARNRAIAAARGEWIAVLDADDRFAPGRLDRLLAFAGNRQADLAFDLIREVDAKGNPIADSKVPEITAPECWDIVRWARDNHPRGHGMNGCMGTGYLKPLIRRAALNCHGLTYRESLRNSEDYALVAELLAAGGAVWVLPDPGYLYTRREGSISHRIGPAHVEALLAFEQDFRGRSGPFEGAADQVLAERMAALEDLAALTRFIDALKARALFRATGAMMWRPRAIGALIGWLGEVLGKRLRMVSTR